MKITKKFHSFDSLFINTMQGKGIATLRITLAIVYIWFGTLKVFGVTPVADLIETTYLLFPEPFFIIFLGLWEIAIGIGLLFKILLRITLALLWLQMAGVFFGFLLSPSLYFINGNPTLFKCKW